MVKEINFSAIAVVCLIGLTIPAAAPSLEIALFDSVNKSPLVNIYGLPGPGNFRLLAEDRTSFFISTCTKSFDGKSDINRIL